MELASNILGAVYVALADHAEPNGTVQLSQRHIARGASGYLDEPVPPHVVAAAITVLIHAGYVVRRPRLDPRNGANTYAIAWADPPPAPPGAVLTLVWGGDAS